MTFASRANATCVWLFICMSAEKTIVKASRVDVLSGAEGEKDTSKTHGKESANLAEWGFHWLRSSDTGFLRSMANRNHVSLSSNGKLAASGEGHGKEFEVSIVRYKFVSAKRSLFDDFYLFDGVNPKIVIRNFDQLILAQGQLQDPRLYGVNGTEVFHVGKDYFYHGNGLTGGVRKDFVEEFTLQIVKKKRPLADEQNRVVFGDIVYLKANNGNLVEVDPETQLLRASSPEKNIWKEFMFEDLECSRGACAPSLDLTSGPLGDREQTLYTLGHLARAIYDFNGSVEINGNGGWQSEQGWLAHFGTLQNSAMQYSALVQKAAFTHPQYPDTVIIAFRGTDDTKGYTSKCQDVAIVVHGPRNSIAECVTFVGLVRELFPNHRIFLTGHSLGGFFAETVASLVNLEGAAFNSPGPIGIKMQNLNTVWHRPRFECHHDMNDPVATQFFPGFTTSCVHKYGAGHVKFKAGWGAEKPYLHMCSQHEYNDLDTGGCHECAGPYYGNQTICHSSSEKRVTKWCVCNKEPSRCASSASLVSLDENTSSHGLVSDPRVGFFEDRENVNRQYEGFVRFVYMVFGAMAVGVACLIAACCIGAYYCCRWISAPS